MGERLERPPLLEAVCEFRFDPRQPWDWTVPGRIYDKIRGEFPLKDERQRLDVNLSPPPGLANPEIQRSPDRVRMRKEDRSAMIQVGPHMLAVNHLFPYPGWNVYRELIERLYLTHAEISALMEPRRIGLRYINRIPLASASPPNLGDYITMGPHLTGALGRPIRHVYQRYELEYSNPLGVLIHQTGTVEVDEITHGLLDLDFVSDPVKLMPGPEGIRNWLDSAHGTIHEAFVASLQERVYRSFRGTDTGEKSRG